MKHAVPLATVLLAALAGAAWSLGPSGVDGQQAAARSGGGGAVRDLAPAASCCDGCFRWCPDDYCPKPCPRLCLPPLCGCCDDYCPKPAPCVRLPVLCGCPDDYCRKPAPCVSWRCGWPAFYKCPPP